MLFRSARRGAEDPGQPRPSVSHHPGAVRSQARCWGPDWSWTPTTPARYGARGLTRLSPLCPQLCPQAHSPPPSHSCPQTPVDNQPPRPWLSTGLGTRARSWSTGGIPALTGPRGLWKTCFPTPVTACGKARTHRLWTSSPTGGRTSSSTAPLRHGTAPRHPAQEVVPTCGQLCGKTA